MMQILSTGSWAMAILMAASLMTACSNEDDKSSSKPEVVVQATASSSTLDNRFPGIRTIPDMGCPEDYVGTTGLIISPPEEIDIGDFDVFGGAEAQADIAATLPFKIHLKGRLENYTDDYYFAVREGFIYFKPNLEVSGQDATWRKLKLPRCLQGRVSEISSDGYVLLALNQQRAIYTLNYSSHDYGVNPWTRRWGPFFWTDLGGFIYKDVRDWAASELDAGADEYFIDGGGRKQTPAGILTVYLLRGDQRRITYLDPWLPMDESREVCGPERGTVSIAGLAGSGSTVMVVTHEGDIYTRLYEFDVSGANTFLLDYSWKDQDGVESPLIQLPAPGWIKHPRVPGLITDRLSLRKISPGTEHRVMRIEGVDGSGNRGYWEKDISESSVTDWHFIATDEVLQGEFLPRVGQRFEPEDYSFHGIIDGYPATVVGFNPYCSPTILRIDFPEQPLELVLHSSDALRQERRARGLDLYPRHYRGAVEVPKALYDNTEKLPAVQRSFLKRYFSQSRFIEGPLQATSGDLNILAKCWRFTRDIDIWKEPLTQLPVPDVGSIAAEVLAAQEQGRAIPICPGIQLMICSSVNSFFIPNLFRSLWGWTLKRCTAQIREDVGPEGESRCRILKCND